MTKQIAGKVPVLQKSGDDVTTEAGKLEPVKPPTTGDKKKPFMLADNRTDVSGLGYN